MRLRDMSASISFLHSTETERTKTKERKTETTRRQLVGWINGRAGIQAKGRIQADFANLYRNPYQTSAKIPKNMLPISA